MSLLRSASLRNVLRSSVYIIFYGLVLMMAATLIEVTFRAFQDPHQPNQPMDDGSIFDGINNETGADHFIVPNIIHLIRFNKTEFSFSDYICLQAAYRNHRPEYFYIHTDAPGLKFHGKFWELVQKDLELRSRIRILHLEPPREIFGQQLNPKWQLYHGGKYKYAHQIYELW